VSSRDPEQTRWWRRPRPPSTGFLAIESAGPAYVTGKVTAFFGLGVACLWGLGASGEAWPWWGRAIGVVVAVASFSGIVVLAAYLHRPVCEELRYDVAEDWAHQLVRTGRVDLGVRPVRAVVIIAFSAGLIAWCGLMVVVSGPVTIKLFGVVGVVVFLILGFLPHLEFATGRGPGLRVDTRGITIARWVPLQIPWSEVIGVRTSRKMQAVVYTTDRFAADYEASRPLLLKVTGAGPGRLGSDGFAIPGTIAAHPDALSSWLTYEADRRRPDQVVG